MKSKPLWDGEWCIHGLVMILVETETFLLGLVSPVLLKVTIGSSLSCKFPSFSYFVCLILLLDINLVCLIFLICREVYAVSIVGPFPIAVTNLLDLTRL